MTNKNDLSNRKVGVKNTKLLSKLDQRLFDKVEKLSHRVCHLHNIKDCVASDFSSLFYKTLLHRGRNGLVQDMKQYRLVLQQYALKQEITNPSYRKVTKDGKLLVIKPFIDLVLDNDINHTRAIMSIFRINELVTLDLKYDYSTITDPQSEEEKLFTLSFNERFKKYLKNCKVLKVLPNLTRNKFPLKNSKGPNTSKALPFGASFLFQYDLKTILKEEFYSSIDSMLSTIGKIDIKSFTPLGEVGTHSKIVSLKDKFGKERVVAMGDVISNWALQPIEESFQIALSKMITSVAYKQELVPDLVKRLGQNLYSADLTAMTDRFPIILIQSVLEERFGKSIAMNWSQILTNRTFQTRSANLRYEVGNPMGLLSSWSTSTFTHHCVLEFIAHENNIQNINRKYIMLGDDVLISDKYLYTKYIETIQNLGIKISNSKCTQSKYGYAEFAKRLFTPEGEITGFPVSLMIKGLKDPASYFQLINILHSRGYDFKTNTCLYKRLNDLAHKRVKKAMSFAQNLPYNYYNLPHKMWVRPSIYLMDKDRFLNLLDIQKVKELEEFERKLSDFPSYYKDVCGTPFPDDHPILTELGHKVFSIFRDDVNGYQLWDKWFEEDMRVSLPNLGSYTEKILKSNQLIRKDLKLQKTYVECKDVEELQKPDKIGNFVLAMKLFTGPNTQVIVAGLLQMTKEPGWFKPNRQSKRSLSMERLSDFLDS